MSERIIKAIETTVGICANLLRQVWRDAPAELFWMAGGFVGIGGAAAIFQPDRKARLFDEPLLTLLVATAAALGGMLAGLGVLRKFDTVFAPQRKWVVVVGCAMGSGIGASMTIQLMTGLTRDLFLIALLCLNVLSLLMLGGIAGFAGGIVIGLATLWALSQVPPRPALRIVWRWALAFAIGGGTLMSISAIVLLIMMPFVRAWVLIWAVSGAIGALAAAQNGMNAMTRILSEAIPQPETQP